MSDFSKTNGPVSNTSGPFPPQVGQPAASPFKASKRPRFVHKPTADNTAVFIWTKQHLDRMGMVPNLRGQLLPGSLSLQDLLDHLIMFNADRPKKEQFPIGAIRSARDQIYRNAVAQRFPALLEEIAHQPNPTVQQALVDLMTLASNDHDLSPQEIAQVVLGFIWQVRRKLHGLPVSHHQMLVLVGPQGAGKSKLVADMCAPLAELLVHTNLAAITDDRNIDLFRSYIGLIDELDKADRASVESLRMVISAFSLDRRPMRENGVISVRQNLTFIGTSNKDVAEVISDPTGCRRFVQVDVIGPTHPSRDAFWRAVTALDWLALWRSVDETAADPCTSIRGRIAAHQAGARSQSLIEVWIEDLIASHHSFTQPSATIAATTLFAHYREWEGKYGAHYVTSLVAWGKEMTRLAKQRAIPFTKLSRTSRGISYRSLGVPRPEPILLKLRDQTEDPSTDPS